jgi:hypothetical protein
MNWPLSIGSEVRTTTFGSPVILGARELRRSGNCGNSGARRAGQGRAAVSVSERSLDAPKRSRKNRDRSDGKTMARKRSLGTCEVARSVATSVTRWSRRGL